MANRQKRFEIFRFKSETPGSDLGNRFQKTDFQIRILFENSKKIRISDFSNSGSRRNSRNLIPEPHFRIFRQPQKRFGIRFQSFSGFGLEIRFPDFLFGFSDNGIWFLPNSVSSLLKLPPPQLPYSKVPTKSWMMQQSSDEKTDMEQETSSESGRNLRWVRSPLPKLKVLASSDMRNCADVTSENAGSRKSRGFWHYCRKAQLRFTETRNTKVCRKFTRVYFPITASSITEKPKSRAGIAMSIVAAEFIDEISRQQSTRSNSASKVTRSIASSPGFAKSASVELPLPEEVSKPHSTGETEEASEKVRVEVVIVQSIKRWIARSDTTTISTATIWERTVYQTKLPVRQSAMRNKLRASIFCTTVWRLFRWQWSGTIEAKYPRA